MNTEQQLPDKLMVLIALAQGLCLLCLHQTIDLEYWLHDKPPWLFALYSATFTLPTMLLLGLQQTNLRPLARYCGGFALLAAALGYYIGSQAVPESHFRAQDLLFGHVLTMTIAAFVALLFIQHKTGQAAAWLPQHHRENLFGGAWRNLLTFTLANLFAGAVWVVLLLWGALFSAINIEFFADLFAEPWFYYPCTTLAIGFGIILLRRLSYIIDSIVKLQQVLLKTLLALITLLSTLFLSTLIFSGLTPLWHNGGSTLVLWLQLLTLLFINFAYPGSKQALPYPLPLHRLVYLGVALLPIYSAISFYGLCLRVAQHGWTLERYWAFLVWFVATLFACSYCWLIVRNKDNWAQYIGRVNVVGGLILLAAMLLVNSPLLDFRKLAANSQLQRLADNTITVDQLDINYLANHLAKPGYLALQGIKQDYADSHPEILLRINQLYSDHNSEQNSSSREEFIAALTLAGEQPPEQLLDTIYQTEFENSQALSRVKKLYLQPIDLDQDAQLDFLLIRQTSRHFALRLYYFEDEQWQWAGLDSPNYMKEDAFDAFSAAVQAGELDVVTPRWKYLQIGNQQIRVQRQHLETQQRGTPDQ